MSHFFTFSPWSPFSPAVPLGPGAPEGPCHMRWHEILAVYVLILLYKHVYCMHAIKLVMAPHSNSWECRNFVPERVYTPVICSTLK